MCSDNPGVRIKQDSDNRVSTVQVENELHLSSDTYNNNNNNNTKTLAVPSPLAILTIMLIR